MGALGLFNLRFRGVWRFFAYMEVGVPCKHGAITAHSLCSVGMTLGFKEYYGII